MMTAENFCYWLQGLFEVGQVKELNETQIQVIKDHLALVFKKETPNRTPFRYVHECYQVDASNVKRDGDKLYNNSGASPLPSGPTPQYLIDWLNNGIPASC